ncbi:unnamed protein product [Euphydryas editha]|uniref:C2H2-type domain-containing protein n=1 Tax=Euphydryas editha TaxID=104508 RepID=A0AAU9TAB1_EUPED|nr:unnamed protein product [Euphydryas editha]
MEVPILLTLKNICCTCLCIDRKLRKLCELEDGINNLFFLLSCDSEAYELLCYREATDLYICWECTALLNRTCKFRDQVCTAQKQLQDIVDNKNFNYSEHNSLSVLSQYHQDTYNYEYILTTKNEIESDDEYANGSYKSDSDAEFLSLTEIANSSNENEKNIIESDLKIDKSDTIVNVSDTNGNESDINFDESDLKIEETDLEIDDSDTKIYDSDTQLESTCEETRNNLSQKNVKKKKIPLSKIIVQETMNYTTIKMTATEMRESLKQRKAAQSFVEAEYKCETCIEVYKDAASKQVHINEAHKKLPNHKKCDICKVYVRERWYNEHRSDHYLKFQCHYCDHVSYNVLIILKHLRVGHAVKNMPQEVRQLRKRSYLKNPGSKPWLADVTPDTKTTVGFVCSECSEFFETKKERNVHIQKVHKRPNLKCSTCDRTFSGIHNLRNHEKLHSGTLPRQPCPICGKVVRYDTMKAHLQVHGERQSVACHACDKTFVSRASYHHHMTSTKTHAGDAAFKIRCPICNRGFRTKADRRDHVNYRHRGKTNHKCPICDKDITALREHESYHTGEMPLSCKLCGKRFRTSGALSTHKRLVHNVVNKLLLLKHTESDIDDVEE